MLWLMAPMPWWIPELAFSTRFLSGLLIIALAELAFHYGLGLLGSDEAEHFNRLACLKRGYRRLTGSKSL